MIINPTRKPLTKREYMDYLNILGESLDPDNFIIGGKMRKVNGNYGEVLYKYDPVAFNAGYQEWKRNKQGHL